MGSRWLGRGDRSKHATAAREPSVPAPSAAGSWRAWLISGARRVPIDSRRARGADAHLKSVLLGRPSGARDFSGAMARQSIDEAMTDLPFEHKQVIRLAYLGGLTNREIADELDLTVGGVRRRLRESLGILSAHVERGRAMGRKTVQGLIPLVWFGRRPGNGWLQTHGLGVAQVMQAGMVAAAAVAAAALLATQPTPAGHVTHPNKAPRVAATGSALSEQPPSHTGATTLAHVISWSPVADAVPRPTAVGSLPVRVQVPQVLRVKLPVHIPVHLPVHLRVKLPVHIPVHLPVHLPRLPLPLKVVVPGL